MNDEDLRGPARIRVFSEARRAIGWLARQFGTDSQQEALVYFHRAASTFSRHIGQIDAGVRSREGGMPTLQQYIQAFTQA